MHLQPYLDFNGRCEQAIEFYKSALGAKVEMLMRFKDNPEQCTGADPANASKVMHASLRIGDTQVMASDGRCQGDTKFNGFCLSLMVSSEEEANRLFTALANGGKVTMPLAKTFFSPLFGMVSDQFGLNWMVLVGH